jgi:hypothetical protein
MVRTLYIALAAAAAMTASAVAHADKGKDARKTGVVEQDIVRSAPDDGKQISLVDIDNRLGGQPARRRRDRGPRQERDRDRGGQARPR